MPKGSFSHRWHHSALTGAGASHRVARTLRGPQRQGAAACPGCPWTAGDVTPHGEDLRRFWLAQHSKKCPLKHHVAMAGPCLDGGVLGSHIIFLHMLFLRIIVHSGASLNMSVLKTPNVSLTPMLLLAPRCSPVGSYPAPPRGPPCYVIRAGFM